MYICFVVAAGVTGAKREAAASAVVEQGREHARRVEPRAAEPIDRPVGGDERGCLKIPDQSVLRDEWVGHAVLLSRPSG